MGFPGSSAVKTLPAGAGDWVQPLSQEDSLEKEMAPIPVFLPGKSNGQRSLVSYSSQGHKESGTTEATWHACKVYLIHVTFKGIKMFVTTEIYPCIVAQLSYIS